MYFKNVLNNKLLTNSLFTLVIRILGVIMLFGLSYLMTNSLDDIWVGYYEFSRVVLLTLATFVLMGTEQSILYFAGKFQANKEIDRLRQVYFKMLKIIWVSSVLVVFIVLIVPDLLLIKLGLKADVLHIIKQCIFILPFYATTILNTEAIRAYEKTGLSEWFRNIFKYIPILIGVFLIIKGLVKVETLVSWYLYGFIFLSFLSFIVLQYITGRSVQNYFVSSEYGTKEIVKISYPMAISSFYTYLLMTIDIFMLTQYFGPRYTAYYAMSMKVMSIISMVIVAVNINYASKIALSFEKTDHNLLQKQLKEAARLIAIINLTGGLILLVGGTFFLSLFGQNYLSALPAYYILITTQIIVSFFGMVPMYMNMTGKQHLFHRIMGITVIVNIVSNLILIPRYNMVGAACSYAISVLLWNFLVAYFSFKFDKVHLTIWK